MIEFRNVTKHYGSIEALRDISLEIEKGSFVLLTGPSGAGKTTLLRTIFAAERPDEGEILLSGWNVTRLRKGSIPYLRRNIGVVFQDFKLLPDRSALRNVALTLEIRGLATKQVCERSEAALQAVGLEHRLHTRAGSLSGGEQQRVAIARAVVGSPSILLADEPTGNLDPVLAREILELLSRICRKGTTVVVATHDPLVVQTAACDMEVMLDHGRMVGVRSRGAAPDSAPEPGQPAPDEAAQATTPADSEEAARDAG